VRKEYRWVRIVLVVLALVSLVELGRLSSLLLGLLNNVSYAGTQAPVVAVEASGIWSATAVLALWAYWFRKRLHQWSAV
jgi:hypothetical protein